MTEETRRRCDRFVAVYDQLRRRYRLEYHLLHALVAFCYTEQGRELDLEEMDAARDLLRRNAGPFSSFRSAVQLIYAGALSLESDPHTAFDRVEVAYAALKGSFFPSISLPLAAFALARAESETAFDATARRAREIFDAMKRDHPFLTGREDVPFAVLAACRGLSASAASAAAESAYTVLYPVLGRTNGVQTASHVLALGADPVAGANTLLALWKALKSARRPFGRDNELVGLAALALSSSPSAALVCEIDDDLRHRRGFGNWTLGARVRRMYAALLASLDDAPAEDDARAFLVTTVLAAATTAMVAQRQAATVAVTVSSAS